MYNERIHDYHKYKDKYKKTPIKAPYLMVSDLIEVENENI